MDHRPSLAVVLLLSLAACDKPASEGAKGEAAAAPATPAIKVELPPTPNFDEGKAPIKWEDGSFSIYGLRHDLEEQLKATEDVQVKGWVQEIYAPPECPKGEVCPPPKQPHIWVTDAEGTEGKKRAMMVVNYKFDIPDYQAKMWRGQPSVVLEKGKRYTFMGKFKQFSDSGFSDDRGLIEFVAYRPLDPKTGQEMPQWVYPPGAPWHPIAVAEQEKANAELVERAAAAKGRPQ